jgi:tetratricopeptide (TPR) repeat protein
MQKESVGIRRQGGRPVGGKRRVPVPSPAGARSSRRWAWLVGGLAMVALFAVGAGLIRARLSHLPPLPAWDGPDPTSGVREEEARLTSAARRAPSSLDAQISLGQFYLDDARPFEALWVLQEAQRLDPRALRPRLLIARALALGQLNQPALAQLQAAVREQPGNAEAAEQLADLQLSLGRPAEAVATLEAHAKRQPLSGAALLLLGRALEASGRDREALQQYQLYQQQEPRSDQIYARMGRLMLRMGRTADAEQAFQAAQILNAHSAEARYYLGMIALRKGPSHEEEARQKFAEAVGVDERFARAHVQLGAYYQRRRDWSRAAAVLQRAFELDPDNGDSLLQLSQVRRAAGDLAGASYYQGLYYDVKDARPRATAQYEAMAAAGNDPQAPLLVSNGYIKMDQKQKASDVARQGLRRHPGDVNLTERLIALDLLTGGLKEAEQLCRDWSRRDPSNAQPIWLLGRIQLANKQRETALKSFEQAARAEPKNPEYLFSLGSAYADDPSGSNWDRAARYDSQAVTLRPDDPRYRLSLGIALQNLGDREGARRQFLRSMDLDPNQSAPLNNLVQVARGMRRTDQVQFWAPLVRDVEERLRVELPSWKRVWDRPRDASGYLPLSRFLAGAGEIRQARNILEQAVALRPDLTAARRELTVLQRTLDAL